MRLKKKNRNKTEFIGLRVNESDFKKIKLKSNVYTDGNLSEWVLNASLNFKPKKEDLEK